jgi:hypothetical protein
MAATDRDPVSVLLPTTEWGTACDDLHAQLGSEDELLVVCDHETDPVAGHDAPDRVQVLVAGEPEGCSGKANALAYAMERGRHDRFVWTDDDFEREADWLETLVAAGERHGPASAIPFFGGDGWWRPVEPWVGALFVAAFYHQVGAVAGTAWGGGVTFTRRELTVDVPTFVAELRTVLSDDYLLTERLPSVHPVQSLVTHVEVPGDARSVYHRLVRFVRIVGLNEGYGEGAVVNTLCAALALLYPLVVAPLETLLFALVYRRYGLRRRNYLFAWPALVLSPLVLLLGLLVREFEWGGRRYRYTNEGVKVLDGSGG